MVQKIPAISLLQIGLLLLPKKFISPNLHVSLPGTEIVENSVLCLKEINKIIVPNFFI